MANFFSGINTGLRALQTQKKSLDVTGHNIANANTEGFSRQRVVQTPTRAHAYPGFNMPGGAGQVGTGVKIAEITRARDQFIDNQINKGKQGLGYWDKRYAGLHRIELIFNEPSDSSLNTTLTDFWKSLQDLSVDPQDAAVRETVKQRGLTLADTFNSLNNQLSDYKQSLNDDVRTIVQDINSLSQRIADLNSEIVRVKGTGNNPNDLMDTRDLLFEQLNTLANVNGYYDSRGNLSVSLGGTRIVDNNSVHELEYVAGEEQFSDRIIFQRTKAEAFITSGELSGILNIRDEEINNYHTKLNEMASTLATRFNEVHKDGFDINGDLGKDFFLWDGNQLSVTSEIVNDTSKIAAGSFTDKIDVIKVNNLINTSNDDYRVTISASGDPNIEFNVIAERLDDNLDWIEVESTTANTGEEVLIENVFSFIVEGEGVVEIDLNDNIKNNVNTFRLADVIAKENLFNDGQANMFDYFKSTLSALGVDGQRASNMVNNQNVLLDQLNNQRESFSGVNLDEEMADMIKYQQAYQAAAKIINTTDRMLDTLMGIIR